LEKLPRLVSLEIDGTVNWGGRIDVQLPHLILAEQAILPVDVYLSCAKQIAPMYPSINVRAKKT